MGGRLHRGGEGDGGAGGQVVDWKLTVSCIFRPERPCWLSSPAPVAASATPQLPSAEKDTSSAGRISLFCQKMFQR